MTSFILHQTNARPTFLVKKNAIDMTVLFDTGAYMSVVVRDEEYVKSLYPNVRETDKLFLLGGFGGKGSLKKVYVIENFHLGDLLIDKFYFVFDISDRYKFDILLCAPLFSNANYQIVNRSDDGKKYLNIDSEPVIHCGLQYAMDGDEPLEYEDRSVVRSVFTFYQEET